MYTNLLNRRATVAAVALGAGVLAIAGCSSDSSSSSSASASAAVGVPGPPAGATVVTAPEPDGAATYSRFSTSSTPAEVETYYTGALKASGFNVTNSGGGGGGWGQYGGSEAGVSANNGTTYVEVNAGGSKQGPTYFEVCSGDSSQAVQSCQGNNHGSSNQS